MGIVNQNMQGDKAPLLVESVLSWYGQEARRLPWRYSNGEVPDPYRVWLSEIMLQQTTVGAVIPYFLKFTEKWPNIHTLARADPEDVLSEWAGLGYYARARNLIACAQVVSHELQGNFPEEEADLLKLPGVGLYTAAAIRAIAFNKPATVIDGNIERIIARLHHTPDQKAWSKKDIRKLASPYFEYAGFTGRAGDFAQALMDIGSSTCAPRSAKCRLCPASSFCSSANDNERIEAADTLRSGEKKLKSQRFGHVYWVENPQGEALLHRRPAKGLLGGMVGLPVSDWVNEGEQDTISPPVFLGDMVYKPFNGISIKHTFTHFHLTLLLFKVQALEPLPLEDGYYWLDRGHIKVDTFPSLFRKALHGFKGRK